MARKNAAAVELGRRGGKARVKSQTVEERIESARRAAQARWAKQKEHLEGVVAEITAGTAALLKKAQKRQKKQQESR